MGKYAIVKNEHDEIEMCNSCCAEVPVIKTKNMNSTLPYNEREDIYFCEICSTTFVGNAFCYPRQYNQSLYATIAAVGNIIRRDIGAFKDKENENA